MQPKDITLDLKDSTECFISTNEEVSTKSKSRSETSTKRKSQSKATASKTDDALPSTFRTTISENEGIYVKVRRDKKKIQEK